MPIIKQEITLNNLGLFDSRIPFDQSQLVAFFPRMVRPLLTMDDELQLAIKKASILQFVFDVCLIKRQPWNIFLPNTATELQERLFRKYNFLTFGYFEKKPATPISETETASILQIHNAAIQTLLLKRHNEHPQQRYTKVPNPKQSFIQNYVDHVRFYRSDITSKRLIEDSLKWNVFKSLRDGHDYVDEIVNLSLISPMVMLSAVGHSILALHDLMYGICALFIRSPKPDEELELLESIGFQTSGLMIALALFEIISAVYIALKSLIGLLIRPIISCVFAVNPSQEDRFYPSQT